MGLVLKILGVLFILLILVVVLVFIIVKRKLKSFINDLAAGLGPESITLTAASVQWSNAKRVAEISQELASLGFQEQGSYEIEEMEGYSISALIHPVENACAVIYDHADLGNWIDLWGRYDQEESLTVSSAPAGGELDHMPGHEKIYLKQASAEALYQKFMEVKNPGALQAIAPDQFVSIFEKAYEDEMEWRNSRGGPTIDEVRRVAENMDGDYSEDEVKDAQERLRMLTNERLYEQCMKEFLETTTYNAAQWNEMQDDCFVIHEKMTAGEAMSVLYDYTEFSEKVELEVEALEDSDLPPFKAVGKIMSLMPERDRYKKVGEVLKPVKAYVLRAPRS